MDTKDKRPTLVRTTVLISEETDQALRQLADDGERPLSWEIRRALEDHVDRQRSDEEPAAA